MNINIPTNHFFYLCNAIYFYLHFSFGCLFVFFCKLLPSFIKKIFWTARSLSIKIWRPNFFWIIQSLRLEWRTFNENIWEVAENQYRLWEVKKNLRRKMGQVKMYRISPEVLQLFSQFADTDWSVALLRQWSEMCVEKDEP